MNIIDKLEKKFGHFSIPNLTYYLIGGQALVYILIQFYPQFQSAFLLEGWYILQGQWWRAVTFLFYPISQELLFAIFIWYIFYLYGSVLERRWGAFKYLIYVLIAYLGTLLLAFVFPNTPLSNSYIYASLFLAFAYLFPEFQLMLFFIIPVKIKWLALITWVGIFASILFGSVPTKVLTLVSISNFLLFFGSDIVWEAKRRFKGAKHVSKRLAKEKAYHICAVCGDNEVDNPRMQIRYCSKCVPSLCYCEDHVKGHKHVVKPN